MTPDQSEIAPKPATFNGGASTFDADEAERFLKLLDPGATAFTFQTFGDAVREKPDRLAQVIPGRLDDPRLHVKYRFGGGVFVAVNEITGQRRTKEAVARVRAVWCEDDSTDAASRVFPIPPSIVVESSPGKRHNYWLVADSWPADKQGRADFDGVLNRMIADHGSDKGVKDISRVLRVPGFLHRKNPATPHPVRLLDPNGHRYTRAEIMAAFPPIAAGTSYKGKTGSVGDESDQELVNAITTGASYYDSLLRLAARFVGRRYHGAAVVKALHDIMDRVPETLRDQRWRDRRGIIPDLVLSAEEKWRVSILPASLGPPHVVAKTIRMSPDAGGGPEGGSAASALKSVRASSIELCAIEWLWLNRFALGKLGLLVGLPDEGKGQIFADMAARVTRGDEWPCGEGRAPKGNVILLTAEDDASDTVVPRLIAAGADLDCIEIVSMVREANKDNNRDRMFSLITDLVLLRDKIAEVGNVKLIQIDPISAYLGVGKIDSFRTTDVRAVLGPLVEMAAELGISIIGIMHFNKKLDVTNALLRISDSLAFGATARHVYAVVDDDENKRKLFVKGKNNLAASNAKALAYGFGVREVGTDKKTGATITAPHIVWHPQHVDVTASEAMQAASESRSSTPRDGAKKFLADLLTEGPVPKRDIEEAAEANCISAATLRRAKDDLEVVAKKDGPNNGWTWRLPDQKAPRWGGQGDAA